MRTVIVGSGPAGLVLGHALLKAGLDDFVILEARGHIVQETGAALGVWPHGVRILDQLGLYKKGLEMTPVMQRAYMFDPKGRLLSENELLGRLAENHGHRVMVLERRRFVQLLYDTLPDNKTRILTNKAVSSIREHASGVSITCTDGTTYNTDILIGADGVHSTIRKLALPDLYPRPPTSNPAAETSPYLSTYKCLFGSSPLPKALHPACMIETHNRGFSFHLLALDAVVCWFIYIRLDEPTTTRSRYTPVDAEDVAQTYDSHSIWENGTMTFGDLWRTRTRAQLVDLEEGVVDRWYAGRVVLVGDAVHKMTPNLALGANNAMEDAVVLVSLLRKLDGEGGGQSITTARLGEVFQEYQERRYARAKRCVAFSGLYTRFAAWDNWFWEALGRYVAPVVGINFPVDKGFGPIAKGGEILEFVKERNWREGNIKWTHRGMS